MLWRFALLRGFFESRKIDSISVRTKEINSTRANSLSQIDATVGNKIQTYNYERLMIISIAMPELHDVLNIMLTFAMRSKLRWKWLA